MADYEIFEHTADIGIRARGATPAEACENAAKALNSLLAQPGTVRPAEILELAVEGTDAVDMLVRWLHELLYEFDAHKRVFGDIKITEFTNWRLKASLKGERLDLARHMPSEEIKAVTYHGARLELSGSGWVAEALLDI